MEGKKTGEKADQPCILLIDELDLLVTRNQSVNSALCNKKFDFIGFTFFHKCNYIALNLTVIAGAL